MSSPTARVPVRHTDAAQRQGLELRNLRLTETGRREDAERFRARLRADLGRVRDRVADATAEPDGHLPQEVLDELNLVISQAQNALRVEP